MFISLIDANTGCWQFKDDYKILLWSVPISPYVNQEAQFTLNFVHDEELIKDLETADVWIDKGGTIIERFNKIQVKDGLATFSYKFDEARFYEINVEFKPKELNKSIALDFPYEVKDIKGKNNYLLFLLIFIFGLIFGLFLRVRNFKKYLYVK